MNSFGNLLWKIFSAAMVFFYHTSFDNAFGLTVKTSEKDPKIQSYFVSTKNTGSATVQTICPSGYYLSKCGSKTLGTEWLKGMEKTYKQTSDDPTETILVKTPDYYSYSEDSDSNNMDNLRKFFAGQEAIVYTPKKSNTAQNVDKDKYVPYRNQLLSNFCTNDTGELANFECEKCPNNAMVSKSTVKQDTYVSGLLVWDSWRIHTIADCYLREFTDDTGSYVYVANSANKDKNNKLNCYYNKTVEGSSLD